MKKVLLLVVLTVLAVFCYSQSIGGETSTSSTETYLSINAIFGCPSPLLGVKETFSNEKALERCFKHKNTTFWRDDSRYTMNDRMNLMISDNHEDLLLRNLRENH
ncbi:MAG: hypothetical protein ACOYIS_08245 [Candidatus Cloacimonadaceae bacterium]|jgi:hypothetical protein